ncbi:MAG: alpha/beta hydrolase [Ectothiorhodospiraceae bacterium]|nr:alpha/beta hydrolase [Ectothiorhodospiraceae bacterium]
MMPVHFGTRERLLFGVYTPAAEPRKRRAVLLLNPWGFEALRAHRSLKHLGDLLARAGMDVFRFDYYGTGDSFGEATEVTLSGCVEDAEWALDEVLRLASVNKASVIGLRFGGLVAARLAGRRPRQVNQLVLWDSVPSGPDYLAELGIADEEASGEPLQRQGFELSAAFLGELADAHLAGLPGTRARVLLAGSGAVPEPEALGLQARQVETVAVEAPRCWEEERDFGAGAVPYELSKGIAAWVT